MLQRVIGKRSEQKPKWQIRGEVTDKAFVKFKNSLKINPNTRRGHFDALDRYKVWKEHQVGHSLTYNELIVGDIETLKDDIEEFMTYERDVKKLGNSSRVKSASTLRKFFRRNHAGLLDDFWYDIHDSFFERQPDPTPVPYETLQIQKILEFCDLKYRAIILLLKDTSFRHEVICRLKLGHLNSIKIGNDVDGKDVFIYRIGPIYSKTRHFYPFCTPETYDAITKYLVHRVSWGEKLDWGNPRCHNDTRYGNAELANTGSCLFRNDSELNKKTEYEINNPEPFSPKSNGVANVIAQSGVRIPKPVPQGKLPDYETPTVHGLREFTINQMKKVDGANIERQKCLTGHSIGTRKHYASYSQEELLEEFKKCIPLLTVTEGALKDIIIERKNVYIGKLIGDNTELIKKAENYETLLESYKSRLKTKEAA